MSQKFLSNIELNAGLVDGNDAAGTSGQILSSTGTGVEWIDQAAISGTGSNKTYYEVKNSSGATILKGKGVMAVGTDGNSGHILIDEMVADGTVEPRYFMGVLEDSLDNGEIGTVIAFGELDQFNTNGQNGETWTNGQILWCDPDSAGDFTTTQPNAPSVKIPAAFILKASTQGKIQIRVQANEGLHELHDTHITTQSDGEILVWDNTNGYWFNDGTLTVDYTNGYVGIGTDSPDTELHIAHNSDAGASGWLTIEDTDTSAGSQRPHIVFQGNGTEIGRIRVLDTTGMQFATGSSTSLAMTIDQSQRVGIGTTSPTKTLDVDGDGRFRGSNLDVGYGLSTSEATFTIGQGRLGSGYSYIDLVGDTTYSDYGLRIIRNNGGANTVSSITHRGTGNFQLQATDSASILFKTYSAERMRIDSSGNIGIGTTSPSEKLDVSGNILATSFIKSGGTSSQFLKANGSVDSNTYATQTWSDGKYLLNTTDTLSGTLTVTSGINAGASIIASATGFIELQANQTDSAAVRLGVSSGSTEGFVIVDNTGAGHVAGNTSFKVMGYKSSSLTEYARFTSTGLGIGTTTPAAKLEVSNNSNATNGIQVSNTTAGTSSRANVRLVSNDSQVDLYATSSAYTGVSSWADAGVLSTSSSASNGLILNSQSGGIKFQTSTTERMRINASGNVGIGTDSPTRKLSVSGSIYAGGKTTYTKTYSSLDTTGQVVAALLSSSNGQSSCIIFTCYGGGGYQRIIYDIKNQSGNWYATKNIDEGVNSFDVVASSNGATTMTFTFKGRTASQSYSPAVTIEHHGAALNTTYL